MTANTHKNEPRTNRLHEETSPYLLQHAHNPVDWYPWGPQALERARVEQKPIFLSVGYSACHWCHVMEHESFENESIAKLLNENFVCIKVDREERPDIDQIYMNVVQLMTGRGGWPMSVFLKPDLTPIFAGTYFPPTDHHGMPGFPRVISEVARIFREKPSELERQSQEILRALREVNRLQPVHDQIDLAKLEKAADKLLSYHDNQLGGFGDAPKFPQTMALTLLLQMFQRTQNKSYLEAVRHTLKRMGEGGIYDHLGGGFARYSVDAHWAVPHFEKMLYDNGLLAELYFKVFQATGESFFKDIGQGILEYVLRDMTAKSGAFFSSEDADSEGEEGKFYAWDPEEITKILGKKDGKLFCRYYGVTENGNFEHGKTVLAVHENLAALAQSEGLTEKDLLEKLRDARTKLFQAREKRVHPGKDKKILVSWNALMIRGFVKGYEVSGEARYLEAAKGAADFILQHMTSDEGKRLWATAKDDKVKKIQAYLDDYAYFTAALLDLFECTGETSWLTSGEKFLQTVIDQFNDPDNGGFYFTGNDHEKLIERPKVLYDASIPSGTAVTLDNLLRFHIISEKPAYENLLQKSLSLLAPMAAERFMGMSQILVIAERQMGPAEQIVLCGKALTPDFMQAKRLLLQAYRPKALLIIKTENQESTGMQNYAGLTNLLAGKSANDKPFRVYFCEGKTCQAPIENIDALKKYLEHH